jgi:hypothetical protein
VRLLPHFATHPRAALDEAATLARRSRVAPIELGIQTPRRANPDGAKHFDEILNANPRDAITNSGVEETPDSAVVRRALFVCVQQRGGGD